MSQSRKGRFLLPGAILLGIMLLFVLPFGVQALSYSGSYSSSSGNTGTYSWNSNRSYTYYASNSGGSTTYYYYGGIFSGGNTSGRTYYYYYNGSQYTGGTYVYRPSNPSYTQPYRPPQTQPSPGSGGGSAIEPSSGLTVEEQEMLNLINQERARAGVAPLTVDMRLVELARKKSQDMVARNYFSHYSPTYGSPFDMLKAAGISYRAAGENIAGAPSVARAHAALMGSSGHRANILNPNYTLVGIGIVSGGPYGKMFTQLFIAPW